MRVLLGALLFFFFFFFFLIGTLCAALIFKLGGLGTGFIAKVGSWELIFKLNGVSWTEVLRNFQAFWPNLTGANLRISGAKNCHIFCNGVKNVTFYWKRYWEDWLGLPFTCWELTRASTGGSCELQMRAANTCTTFKCQFSPPPRTPIPLRECVLNTDHASHKLQHNTDLPQSKKVALSLPLTSVRFWP